MYIPFNKPYLSGKELEYIHDAVERGKISGNGHYTKLCQSFFESEFGFKKCLLTTSCTDALEMAAILINIQPGDEVILPSYTFVSTANAFVLRGAKLVFVDSRADHPGMQEEDIEQLITPKTKAVVVVHYAGVASNMDRILELAKANNFYVVEDAAQGIDSYYKERPLGGIGHLGAFSFHETKNIQCGEGGLLIINDESFLERSEIIWEKGTNRSAFFRGEIDKYGWVDIGSSFLPSELNAAYLLSQLEHLQAIQQKRKEIWHQYYETLGDWAERNEIRMPSQPEFSTNNAHMFYLVCKDLAQRNNFISHLKEHDILSVFHYLSLHESAYFIEKHDGRKLPNSDAYSDRLVRLPLYYDLDPSRVIESILQYEN